MDGNKIIIIGGGAAGLMAAKELSAQGEQVVILEARDRMGGRIHTYHDAAFSDPVELGPEFVHGDLPITKNLLAEAGIAIYKAGGEMWQKTRDDLEESNHITAYWDVFEEKIKDVEKDMTINEFLEEYFGGDEYMGLREAVRRYAAGYDTADPDKASTIALRDEWTDEGGSQYRVSGGYGAMIGYLTETCAKQGCAIHLNTVAKKIEWQKGAVTITTADGSKHEGKKVIITLPLSIMQAEASAAAAITFSPAIPEVMNAIQKMGIGAIIKILFEFKTAFWMRKETTKRIGKDMSHVGFILSDESIPTWWTQYPAPSSLLTGWLGGPLAKAHERTSDEALADLAVTSLANIFKTSPEYIREQLATWKVCNWTADKYSLGSYSYATVDTKTSRAILDAHIADTIYFAGEAMYDGPVMGTVEGALASGKKVAEQILNR